MDVTNDPSAATLAEEAPTVNRSLQLVLLSVLLGSSQLNATPRPMSQVRWEYRQPSVHESKSGEFQLLDDPSDREGRGPARLTLRRDGRTIWSAEHPFTFWECLVSDRGEVFGYCYSSPPTKYAKGETRIVLISPRGEVLVNEVHPRVFNPIYGHGPPLPYVGGLHLREDLALGIVHLVIPHDRLRNLRPWWSYDLTTGLVRAKGEDEAPENRAFVRDGEFVPEPVELEAEGPASRRPQVDWTGLPPMLELEKLPSLKLQNDKTERTNLETLDAQMADLCVEEACGARIDGCGRVAVVDTGSRFVHVFNSAGEQVLVARGERLEIGPIGSKHGITISGDGQILAESPSRHPVGRQGEEYAVFDELGQFVEKRHLAVSEASFVKGTETYWGDRDGRLLLLDMDGEIIRRLDRRPDNRFWTATRLAAGKGRELVVLDRGNLIYYDDQNPSGRVMLRRQIGKTWNVTHGGRWIVIEGRESHDLLFDTRNRRFHLLDIARDLPEDANRDIGFSADSRELWALELSTLVLHRYALPSY